MSNNLTVTGNKEIIVVAESIAREQGIETADIIGAIEDGIIVAAKKKYGSNLQISCQIDKKTGSIKLFNQLEVVEDEKKSDDEFDFRKHIALGDAIEKNNEIAIGEFISEELPPIDLSRSVSQIAGSEIIKKVNDAKRLKEYNEFKDRIGELVNAAVKKVGVKNIVMEIDGHEGVIHESGLMPRETFRVGDRFRVYIEDVRQEEKGSQIFLSRTHPQFLVKLFGTEVPELYEGIIDVKAVARDPGSRAKIAIASSRDDIDIIGSFIGIRGSRVQSVSSELRGEKIDVIKYSPNIAEFVVNALTPAKCKKVVVDEENQSVEVVVGDDQLSIAIGRGGQNVKLASKLVNFKIDVMTEEQESSKRTIEFNKSTKLFVEALDVDEIIANLLASEGFTLIQDIAEAQISEIANIEGFDEDIASEIQQRAIESLQGNNNKEKQEEEKEEENLDDKEEGKVQKEEEKVEEKKEKVKEKKEKKLDDKKKKEAKKEENLDSNE